MKHDITVLCGNSLILEKNQSDNLKNFKEPFQRLNISNIIANVYQMTMLLKMKYGKNVSLFNHYILDIKSSCPLTLNM